MAYISLRGVAKTYGDGFCAVRDLTLDVADGEFMVLVGPSGCGKSTALRMIAGLETITEGELRLGGRRINDVDPKDRDIAMVFQSYALYPHKTVRENIAFPLLMARLPHTEVDRRVAEAARALELTAHLDRRPASLSGGQRQRVAMGRAIVRQPAAFLMDEPLSNLDAKLRVQMRAEVARLQRALRVTTVYVTHDQVEAMTMGDRVAVLKGGTLQQVGPPQELYARPANVFVAAFIGSPSMNLFEATIDGARLTLGSQAINLPDEVLAARPSLRAYSGRKLIIGIRPEDIDDSAVTERRRFAEIAALVTLVEALGAETMLHLALDAPSVDAGDPDAPPEAIGARAAVARASPRTRLRPGDRAQLAVEAGNLHFFDPDTREGIW